jgi:hypothetical protein
MLSDGSVGPGGGGGEDGHREEGAQRLLPGPHHQQDHQVAQIVKQGCRSVILVRIRDLNLDHVPFPNRSSKEYNVMLICMYLKKVNS